MQQQSYYVPSQSALPIMMAIMLFVTLFSTGHIINSMSTDEPVSVWFLFIPLIGVLTVMFFWFRKVIIEDFEGKTSEQLHKSYVWGMCWFIFSEAMLFFAFFFALFYLRFFVVPWIAGEGDKAYIGSLYENFVAAWPLLNNPDPTQFPGPQESMAPPGFAGLFGWLPIWNTIILVTSSFTVSKAHHGLLEDDRKTFNLWLLITILLGVIFLFLQVAEYSHAYSDLGLTMDSGVYGSTFFVLTGFHGAHVTIGTLMLFIMLLRSYSGHFTSTNHFGFAATAWYWHFVDVVWVFLFIFVYLI